MQENPYQPPDAELIDKSVARHKVLFQILIWSYVAYIFLPDIWHLLFNWVAKSLPAVASTGSSFKFSTEFIEFDNPLAFNYVMLLFDGVTLIGCWGIAFAERIGKPIIWRLWLVVAVGVLLYTLYRYGNFYLYNSPYPYPLMSIANGDARFFFYECFLVLATITQLLLVYSVYYYAFHCDIIWTTDKRARAQNEPKTDPASSQSEAG